MVRGFLKWLPIVSATLIAGAIIAHRYSKKDNRPELEKEVR